MSKAGQLKPFRDESREQAYKKRYNRNVKIFVLQGKTEQGQSYYTLYFNTPKGTEMTLTEFYTPDFATDYVNLSYKHGERVIINKFKRFVDAEISLADKVSEEEYSGNIIEGTNIRGNGIHN